MKKTIILILLGAVIFNGVFAESSVSETSKKVLFIYEENNENIDPWLIRLRSAFEAKSIKIEARAAAEMTASISSSYDLIYIYGAVMAFTAKEPIRDWLEKEPDLSGQKVILFVTANRWFLDKYTGQLKSLLEKGNADIVDTVSSATKELTEEDRIRLIEGQVDIIKNL